MSTFLPSFKIPVYINLKPAVLTIKDEYGTHCIISEGVSPTVFPFLFIPPPYPSSYPLIFNKKQVLICAIK